MRKLFIGIQAFFAYLFAALPAFAQAGPGSVIDPCSGNVKGENNPIGTVLCNLGSNPGQTIGNIIVIVIIISIVIALFYLVYGAVRWITSRGEKEQIEGARNQIIAAIIGLILIFLTIFIMSFVLGVLGIRLIGEGANVKIPSIGG